MAAIDWSVLSGPRVSRRTLAQVAAASGAAAFAAGLGAFKTVGAPRIHGVPALRRQEPTQGGRLRVGFLISQIVTLDPQQLSQGVVAGSILPSIFSSLVQFDQELGLIPDLAETWEVTEDGLGYTFALREGLTFHNGDTLTSEDVRYTYERTTNPDFASPHANKLALVEALETPDERTVNISLSAPFAPFLAVACTRGPGRALTPVPRRAVEEMGDEQFGLTPVGSGPFAVVPESVEVGRGFEMTAFEGWYGGRPYLDAVEVQLIPEASSAASALEAGDVDVIDPAPATLFEQLAGNPDLVVMEGPSTSWRGVVMNQARPPWDNPDARMAVAKALNRQAFVDTGFFGLAIPAIGAIAPAFGWAYLPPEEVEDPQAYNLDEAKALAEWAGILGARPVVISSEEIGQRPTEVLRTQLTELGLDPQIDFQQASTFNERWQAGDYDMFLHGSVVDADPDDGHWNIFFSEGPWNTFGYKSEEADRLLVASRETSDQGERARLFQELQGVLQRDVAAAFAYHAQDLVAMTSVVTGLPAIPEQRYYEKVSLEG
ncbi:MAG TPA: ABC transporter substrate-binding protein [Thermomicrobiales bacterium]|nr:ABC transporter substrate-binding protein [Thermomicrobiales bacterium]